MTARALVVWAMYAKLAALALLVFAAGGFMSHDDFRLMRLAVFPLMLFAAYAARRAGSRKWSGAIAAFSLAFNPIVRPHMPRGAWVGLDLAAAALLGAAIFGIDVPPRERE
jgi:hypothetical protein